MREACRPVGAVGPDDTDDIEADRPILEAVAANELVRQGGELPLLVAIHVLRYLVQDDAVCAYPVPTLTHA